MMVACVSCTTEEEGFHHRRGSLLCMLSQSEAAFRSHDCWYAVLEKLFKQTAMAANQPQSDVIPPVSEWDSQIQVSTH